MIDILLYILIGVLLFVAYIFIGAIIGVHLYQQDTYPFWKKEHRIFKILYRNKIITKVLGLIEKIYQH